MLLKFYNTVNNIIVRNLKTYKMNDRITTFNKLTKIDIDIFDSKLKKLDGIKFDEFKVNFDPVKFTRKTNEDLEKQIEEEWSKKSEKNAKIYNQTKFRLHKVKMNNEQNLEMDVAITCYKDHCGTNLVSNFSKWQEKGQNEHENSQAFMADALGNTVYIL